MTTGLLGRKVGTTQVFLEDGRVEPVSVVEAGPCVVTQVKTLANDGYEAVQLGFGEARRLNRPMEGHLQNTGRFRYLRELPAKDLSQVQVGQKVDVSLFQAGDLIDVIGTSKGRGFAGGVKRYHFKGGKKTHGQSDRQRAPGAIGSGTTPGRVIKGLRMAGHMGSDRVTTQNLKVVRVDAERNLLLIRGSVPGAGKGLLVIRHAKKAQRGAGKGAAK